MLSKEQSESVIACALRASLAEQTEVVISGQAPRLTRYSENYIHQNVAETGHEVTVRAVNGKKIGSASVNQLDEESVEWAARRAHEMSLLAPPTAGFVSLPAPRPAPAPTPSFYESTASCPADLRAAYVDRVIAMGEEKGVKVAGAISTGVIELAVGNSLGTRAYEAQTRASLSCVAMSATSSGYAEECALDLAQVDPTRVAERAISKCLSSQNAGTVPPGEYDVILEPNAVGSMLLYLGFLGMTAEAYQEGRSFMSGNLGKRVAGENITIWDDGLDPAGQPMPFDFEGVPKQKVSLIENGIARGVVYNSLAAAKEGRESTGHAVAAEDFVGSMPTNLFMAGGQSTLQDMVASTKKGILVTRFHYVNPVHPLKAVITGMTRDGTFLIEDGRIVRGLRNLRFTQSILEALSRVEALSAERETTGGFLSIVCPAIKVLGFNFTGATEF